MKKVDGLYWDEKPDWQHDKWQFQQLLREIEIYRKRCKDYDWILGFAHDLKLICEELKEKNDIASALLDIELLQKIIYYQDIAINMYETKSKE